MTSLIDDILMISRLESKDAEVTLSKVNLKSVMDEVLESLTPQAASCKVEISGSCGNVILQASLQQMRELFIKSDQQWHQIQPSGRTCLDKNLAGAGSSIYRSKG